MSRTDSTIKQPKIKKPKKSDVEHSFAQKYSSDFSKKQIATLIQWGGSIRLLSNAAKEEREIRYQQNKNRPESQRENINSYSQLYSLPEIKNLEGFEFIGEIPSQVLQQSLMDLHKSFQDFFKNGRGYPRWKSRVKDGVQLRFPDGKNIVVEKLNRNNSRVFLPKMGWLRFKTGGRKIPNGSRIRSCTIRGNADGSDFSISFNIGQDLVEFQKSIPKNNGAAVGIDRGIAIAAQLSTGESFIFPNEKIKLLEKKLAKEQRKLSKKKKPRKSKNVGDNKNTKRKTKVKVGNFSRQNLKIRNIHTKIKNIRLDFNHKMTTAIAKNHGLVVLEDLKLKNMMKSARGTLAEPGRSVAAKSGLNRSLARVGLGMQSEMLSYKIKWYRSHLVFVNPRNTSRKCSECGHVSKKNRKSQSIFSCVNDGCGHAENADLNASKIILARGHRVLACGVNVIVAAKVATKKVFVESGTSKKLRRKVA